MKKTLSSKIKQLVKKPRPLMLNLGCGTDYKPGWVNIDNNSDNNIEKLDLNWDLRNRCPTKMAQSTLYSTSTSSSTNGGRGQICMKDFMQILKPVESCASPCPTWRKQWRSTWTKTGRRDRL